jgi:Ser/Thr protein kinase RdoA (MazF antagonist)
MSNESNLLNRINEQYSIGTIINVKKSDTGNAYFVDSESGKFIAKTNERHDFVSIFNKVQNHLNINGFKQSRIIKTIDGKLLAQNNMVLYEAIPGTVHSKLTRDQSLNVIRYIKSYNTMLSQVEFSETELLRQNNWDKARSLEFIANELKPILNSITTIDQNKLEPIFDSIEIIQSNYQLLTSLKKQLVHADMGSDNFIFNEDKVVSVIDFTPDYSYHVYPLAQFVYWDYLWQNENITQDGLFSYLEEYNREVDETVRLEVYKLFLIIAAVFRVAGPLLNMLENPISDLSKLEKRLCIVSKIVKTC